MGLNFQSDEGQPLDSELFAVWAAAVVLVAEVEATVVLCCSLPIILAAFVVLLDDGSTVVVVCTTLSDPSSWIPCSVVSSKLDDWPDSVS